MERFARLAGFDGSAEQWETEYISLCEDNGRPLHRGIDGPLLLKLMGDASPKGCYCYDQDIQSTIYTLEATFAAPSSTGH